MERCLQLKEPEKLKSFLSTSKFYIALSIIISFLIFFLIIDDSATAHEGEEFYYSYSSYYKPVKNETIFHTRSDVNEIVKNIDYVEFYNQFIDDETITKIIVEKAIEQGIPIHLAISISWKESRFYPDAIGENNNDTKDIGLFQLNNRYHNATFDPSLNSEIALSYLKDILYRFDGDIVNSLYAYNAGQTRVSRGDIPSITFQYAEDVLQYEAMLDKKFNEWLNPND